MGRVFKALEIAWRSGHYEQIMIYPLSFLYQSYIHPNISITNASKKHSPSYP